MGDSSLPFADRPENASLVLNAGAALDLVGNQLESVRMLFGAKDFPTDNGVAFRNEFWRFPVSFLVYELQNPSETEIRDSRHVPSQFIATNFPRLRLCTAHQLVYLAGVLHMKGITAQFIEARPERPYWKQEHFRWIGKRLDWVANTYGLGSEAQPISTHWFDACKLTNAEAHERTKSMLYSEVVHTVGVDPDNEQNKSAWSGMAWICLDGYSFDDEDWSCRCNDAFG